MSPILQLETTLGSSDNNTKPRLTGQNISNSTVSGTELLILNINQALMIISKMLRPKQYASDIN